LTPGNQLIYRGGGGIPPGRLHGGSQTRENN